MKPDIQKVAALIEEVAAIEILPRFERLAAHEIREKSPGDLVTVADEAAEAWLTPRLLAALPDSLVLGEEAAAAAPEILRHLVEAESLWLIDPIDGTANFAGGRPRFAVMIAYLHRGQAVASWIYDPVGRRMAVAERGAGAFIDGRRLAVAPPPAGVAEMTGTLHVGQFGEPALRTRVQERRHLVAAVKSLRCAGLEYMRLADGQIHFSLYSRLMPWDHAPGVLLHAEAGGHAAYLEGGSYDPARIDARGLMLAPDAASWQALHDLLLAPDANR
jgi:fructose-1,6-bisphosphatase/inositol monophosphatase family enzyme